MMDPVFAKDQITRIMDKLLEVLAKKGITVIYLK
jgi:hypothetical protein